MIAWLPVIALVVVGFSVAVYADRDVWFSSSSIE